MRRTTLAAARDAISHTQEELAERLGVDVRTVRRWESGHATPRAAYRPPLARAFGISLRTLDKIIQHTRGTTGHDATTTTGPGRAQAPATRASDDDMNRRDLLRAFSLASTLLALPAATADATELLDAPVLDGYAALNNHLWRTYRLTSVKADVLPVVHRQLDVLTADLRTPHDASTHLELCRLAGNLFQLAGEVFLDGGRHADAAHCYTLAASASAQAGDHDLWACALTRHAYISLYERQFDHANDLLDLAATQAARGDRSLSTRHWVASIQAHAHAELGDFDACLAEERGSCYATLGRTDLATKALTTALVTTSTPRRKAGVLTDLAILAARDSDPDRVLDHATAVLDIATDTDSTVVTHKLAALRPHLAPLRANPRIRHLNAEILTLTN